ncbi:recombinase family protein [bacterium 210820-DFI.6.52]|nr:recombinase family protein [bacterium 210820-DFI.6.52]
MKRRSKCYIYTRVSTAIQVDGYSLDAQKDKLRKYAEYEDMIVAAEYSDEGFSGKNIQGRLEFQRMLNDIQEGKDGVSYVLVFKLSRFGRNAADVLNSLQLMQDFGVNLICVEDGIDSSKDSGKLMISILSAVAEIERENIRTQTMAGREQKAREGKWNGGFAPYGYRLENGNLVIAEDEVEVIRIIYDRYIHTNEGLSAVANYLNNHGYTKKLRQNGTIPGFSSNFVKDVLDNPVYMGKIAYGRRRTEKKLGTRNEFHVVEKDEFPVYEGQHEAIISEEDWNLAQEKRKINAFKREKVHDPEHAHILSGILKCPCCGKSLYGNIAKAHSKDKKTRYYYYCKNTVGATGHKCTFRVNIEQQEMNRMVAAIISAMVNDSQFSKAIKEKIGTSVDTEDLEKQLAALQAQLRQTLGIKTRLERQMDTMDINDPHFDRKILDLQRRYDEQYGRIEEIEAQMDEVKSQIQSIRQKKISGDNIYQLLLMFDEVYGSATEFEQKEFMQAFIERIDLYPEKQEDGNWIRNIVFNFPVPVNGQEVKELPLETGTTLESIVLMSRVKK